MAVSVLGGESLGFSVEREGCCVFLCQMIMNGRIIIVGGGERRLSAEGRRIRSCSCCGNGSSCSLYLFKCTECFQPFGLIQGFHKKGYCI